MTEPIKRRRWFRFSLRMLLVVMTVLCIWLGFTVNAARRQKAAVDTILEAGGSVLFDYQNDPKSQLMVRLSSAKDLVFFSAFVRDPNALPPGPTWLRKQFGDDYFRNVIQVNLPFSELEPTRAAINQLASLPSLKSLLLNVRRRDLKIQDSDLFVLGALNQLERLMIRHSRITGEFLARLQNPARLVQVDIEGSEVDDAAMQQFSRMTNLESLLLDSTRITDAGIIHLHKLTKLKVLSLSHTNITQNGVRELQKALPNTIIYGP